LDIETLRALEDAILVFPGTVMVVSHDRWFLDRIATHILSFENEQPEFYEGNYAEYEAYRQSRLGDAVTTKRAKYKKITG
jgi:ATPase subunit of ABC transporter with duplicated ATPase domains